MKAKCLLIALSLICLGACEVQGQQLWSKEKAWTWYKKEIELIKAFTFTAP